MLRQLRSARRCGSVPLDGVTRNSLSRGSTVSGKLRKTVRAKVLQDSFLGTYGTSLQSVGRPSLPGRGPWLRSQTYHGPVPPLPATAELSCPRPPGDCQPPLQCPQVLREGTAVLLGLPATPPVPPGAAGGHRRIVDWPPQPICARPAASLTAPPGSADSPALSSSERRQARIPKGRPVSQDSRA